MTPARASNASAAGSLRTLALMVGLLCASPAAPRTVIAAATPAATAPAAAPAAASEVAQPVAAAATPAAAPWTLDDVLAALREVETGGCPDQGRHARGDGGAALGPYQIHHAYWRDSRVAGEYEQCRDAEYARTVVLAYWHRYCPSALETVDAEVLARVHNGGPRGHEKRSTLAFWERVERELLRQAAASRRRPTT